MIEPDLSDRILKPSFLSELDSDRIEEYQFLVLNKGIALYAYWPIGIAIYSRQPYWSYMQDQHGNQVQSQGVHILDASFKRAGSVHTRVSTMYSQLSRLFF